MSKKEILQFLKKTIANSHKVCDNSKCNIEVWLSLVEHHVRDVGVASSNLVTSTKKDGFFSRPLFLSVPIFGLDKPNFRFYKK